MHTLYILGIDAFETRLAHHSVNHIERVIALVDGVGTTNTDFHRPTGQSVGNHVDTGHTTLQSIAHLRDGLVAECLVVEHGNRTGKVGLTHRTVTHNHYLVEDFGVLGHGNIKIRLSINVNLLSFITDVGEPQSRPRSYLQSKISVNVRNNAVGRSVFNDAHTD